MKKIILILGLVNSLLFANDGSASNTMESYEDKVIINDIPLSYNIEIVGSNSRFVADLLDARVIIRNKDSEQHNLEYKFVWYDESGFEMAKHLTKWKRVRIDAKDKLVLKSLAVTPQIDSFKFYVRGIENN